MIWLVAEDETDIRVLITTMIQVWGHQTAAYENGQKVWDWLDRMEAGDSTIAPPELVLMDIRMPGKKGNEVAARMRTVPSLAKTPIVLMTAYSMTDAERTDLLERDGADLVIQKPLPEFDQLRKLLHDLVQSKQATAAASPELAKPSEVASAPEPAEPAVVPAQATNDVAPAPAPPADEKASVPKTL